MPNDDWSPRLRKLLQFDFNDGITAEEKNELKATITPGQARLILDLVKPLKCCDPAVGSGAFPVGLMQELVSLRRLLETVLNGYRDPVVGPQGSGWLHDTKADIVENSLYGVDIQEQAIEICRLRLWLSLVVDYDLGLDPFTAEHRQFSEAINRISQLPNLEMNFRRGDSLHDHISGVPLLILPDRASRHTSEFAAIANLGSELHQAKRADRKKKLRLDILERRLELSRKIVEEELRIIHERDSALDRLFGEEESDVEKRKRNRREIEHLKNALTKIEADRRELGRLRQRDADPQFYPRLRKLEGADFDSPFNFVWSIDFPGVFDGANGGFDIIVGNPPFVTARSAQKRELWRQRWPRVAFRKYELVAPFIECSFNLLRKGAELGFIVSNGFTKREFGKPLVDNFFPTVDLQKIVDCSGLLFPGHGTPTLLMFGSNEKPARTGIRNVCILPGGGDLRTPPEDSSLWMTIATHHDVPTGELAASNGFIPCYEDKHIAVADCDRPRMLSHPCTWNFFEWPTFDAIKRQKSKLGDFLEGSSGVLLYTGADEVYVISDDMAHRLGLERNLLKPYATGEDIRNWEWQARELCIFPYDAPRKLSSFDEEPRIEEFLDTFEWHLSKRITFGKTHAQRDLDFKEYSIVVWPKLDRKQVLVYPNIATHNHFVLADPRKTVFKEKAPVLLLNEEHDADVIYPVILSLLNSSSALFWMKQVFFNKGAGEEEHRDRFEFSGGKLEKLPIPQEVADSIRNSQNCSQITIALKTFATTSAEASKALSSREDFRSLLLSTVEICRANDELIRDCEQIRSRLIALQEEMDWIVYVAYELIPPNHPAARWNKTPELLNREERPFRLWERAEENYEKAVALIPKSWTPERRRLWEARLIAIRDNEHIRRIEQPVYKRRWDEQWKVGNRWRCGGIAYAAEFLDAFEWWLKERAERWLENRKTAEPMELVEWTSALWKDARVQAAWRFAAEQYLFVEHELACEKAEEEGKPTPTRREPEIIFSAFERRFRQIVEEETVPEGFPFGFDYDDLKKRLKKEIPAKLKKVRGQLNVPRERFHSVGRGQYKWAGLQFKKTSQKSGR